MTTRDLALAAVAALAVIGLVILAWAQPPAAEQIITGIVGLGGMALGRISAATRGGDGDTA